MFLLNLILLSVAIESFCDVHNIISPCPKNDEECQTKVSAAAMPKLFDGIPSLGIERSDPLYLEHVVGDLSTLKFEFFNTTVTGFRNCKSNKIRIDWEDMNMHVDLTCKDINASGQYKLKGSLLLLPVEGDGDFKLHIKKYQIKVDVDLRVIEDKDGTKHLMMKKYKVDGKVEEGVHYDFSNLFNGRQDLANTVLTFANQNWKEVADFVQSPVINAVVKKFVARGNKFLKSVPLEELSK